MRSRLVIAIVLANSIGLSADVRQMLAAEPQAANKQSALTADQIARGRAIREVLVAGIDFAREHGEWPRQLSELKIKNVPAVTYLGPPAKLDGVDRSIRGRLKSVSPVCRESFDQYSDGVWVGYADGHIELVRDAVALRSGLSQLEQARPLLEKAHEKPVPANAQVPKPDAKLIVKLVDDSGQPVEGAQVGYLLWNADYDLPGGRGKLATLDDKASQQETTSDALGRVEVQYQWFFKADDPPDKPAALIASHKERGLIAVTNLYPDAFSKGASAVAALIEVKLRRCMRVTGSLSRISALAGANKKPFMYTDVYTLDGNRMPAVRSLSQQQAFEFLLPPGDYLLNAHGENAYDIYRFLHLTNDMDSVQLHLDLPPDRLASLMGKTAPELQQIKAWKNGGPTTLQQLRGKWVVLDFWGYWCESCVQAMPELMKLHDDFGDKGLVLIAVHDDSVDSIEKMDKNLEQTKKEVWKGRDLPFLVALAGGGATAISGTEIQVSGATPAAYGVVLWPTTVLIDPQGKIVWRRVDPLDPELRNLLEKELGPAK